MEVTTTAGEIDERIMQQTYKDRALTIIAPSGYELPYNQSVNAKDLKRPIPSNTNRDFPGVFGDFGSVYTGAFFRWIQMPRYLAGRRHG